MYPLLILREEIVCLVILAFLLFTSKAYDMGKDSRTFYTLAWLAVLHVVFDVITIWTVNHIDTTPYWVNYIAHVIFYMAAILFSHQLLHYVVKLCYKFNDRKRYLLGFILPFLYLVSIPFLGIDYITGNGTNSSSGSAVIIGFAIAFLYFLTAIVLILINRKKLSRGVVSVLLPVLVVLILSEFVQIVVREFLFTGAAVTIVTVAFFFSLENPVHVFEQKVNTDAMTGVNSRHRYEQDIKFLEERFNEDRNSDFIIAYCDINDLRTVNTRFGHSEGDRYITFVAAKLINGLKNASGIYRMGGDEFLVVYYKKSEDLALSELRAVQEECAVPEEGMNFIPGLSVGYAISGPEYRSLNEVMRTADFYMYRNKSEKNSIRAFISNEDSGKKINLSGLTDKLFDAMCESNERSYPFLTNLDTGVTRISHRWVEYFNLPSEFLPNFDDVWIPHIHPEDRQAYIDDITATLTGKQQFHSCEYRALTPDGEYVLCSCQGAIYHEMDGISDFFSGTLINHGIRESADAITGLWNFSVLDEKVGDIIRSGGKAIILKLGINNFSRINMLYGYIGGHSVLKAAANVLSQNLKGYGDVYCEEGTNFSILLPNTTKETARVIYERIHSTFTTGILVDDSQLPIDIACGAYEIVPGGTDDRKSIRSSLICALEESTYNEHGKVVFYDELKARDDMSNYSLLKEIHQDALNEKKNFHMCYQAIAETRTGKVIGAEALLRWASPELGEIAPGRFIDFLENDPCFYDLGIFILRESISAAREMKDIFPGFSININVTALQLQREDFIDNVLSILDEYNYPANSLVLELTERCKEMNSDFLRARIDELRSHRIRVAFDDMGTGYSTIDLLMNIPVDEIKLDKTFVNSISTNFNYRIFVEALMRGTMDRKYIVCFEGVETESMVEYLRRFGTSFCQGYYFSKPLTKDDFCERLATDFN